MKMMGSQILHPEPRMTYSLPGNEAELVCQEHIITYIETEFKKPDTDPGSLNDVHVNQGRMVLIAKAETKNNIHCAMITDAGYCPGS